MERLERGRWAERRVESHLRRRGWRILARNWIGGGGELDLVASRWRTLLVVEVRYRAAGDALQSVDADKFRHLIQAARFLIRSQQLQRYRLRIDLVGVAADGRLRRQRDVLRLLRPRT